MSKLVRYCVTEEEHTGENCFYIARPSILSNPYTHIKDRKTKAQVVVKSREEAIELYKVYFNEMMKSNDKLAIPFKNEFNRIVDAYRKFDVVYIGCYCHLNESCHGDFIIEQVIKTVVKEDIKNRTKKID